GVQLLREVVQPVTYGTPRLRFTRKSEKRLTLDSFVGVPAIFTRSFPTKPTQPSSTTQITPGVCDRRRPWRQQVNPDLAAEALVVTCQQLVFLTRAKIFKDLIRPDATWSGLRHDDFTRGSSQRPGLVRGSQDGACLAQ